MNKNYLKHSLVVLLCLVALNASAASNTINYTNKTYKVSFAHSANYLNYSESENKRKNDFIKNTCPGGQVAKCKSSKELIIKKIAASDKDISTVRKNCNADLDCLSGVDKLVSDFFDHYIEGKPLPTEVSLSAEEKNIGETTFRASAGPDNFSYSTSSMNRESVTKGNLYKKNKYGVTFYWTTRGDMCGFLKTKDVCFSTNTSSSEFIDAIGLEALDTPVGEQKLEKMIRDKKIKIFGPIVDTFKFL